MDKADNLKITNQALSALLLIFGTMFLAAGAMLLISMWDDLKTISRVGSVGADAKKKECLDTGKRFKIPIRENNDGTLTLSIEKITDPDSEFSQLSALALACQYYDIDYVCVGVGCPKNQFEIRLKPWE